MEEPEATIRDSQHGMTVEFSPSDAAEDWEMLLAEAASATWFRGGSDLESVVAILIERLWDAAMVTQSTCTQLVYVDGYFEGVSKGKDRA